MHTWGANRQDRGHGVKRQLLAGVATAGTLAIGIAALSSTASAAGSGLAHYAVARAIPAGPVTPLNVGTSMDIDGNTLVVGDQDGTVAGKEDAGAVDIFTITAATGALKQVAQLYPAVPSAFANFGQSVAISDNTIVVGETGGRAFVFVRPASGWKTTSTPTATLTASATSDYFGKSVDISGNTIVVGDYEGSGAAPSSGAAYVFSKPPTGWADMTATAKLTSSDGADNNYFGASVAVDGSTVVVGAEEAGDHGQAYVFTKPGTAWTNETQQAILSSVDAKVGGLDFGENVAISGNTVVVSEPESTYLQPYISDVYVYAKPAAGWPATMTQTATLDRPAASDVDGFGSAIAISGRTIVVGEPYGAWQGKFESGLANVFTEPSTGWKSTASPQQFVAYDTNRYDGFGGGVAVTANQIIVGANGHSDTPNPYNTAPGAVYVFTKLARPVLTKVKESRKSWKRGHRAPKLNPRRHPRGGTVLSFTVSEPSQITLTFRQKHHPARALTYSVHQGRNTVYIDGPLGHHHKLAKGKYRVTLRAVNAAADHSAAKTLRFKVR